MKKLLSLLLFSIPFFVVQASTQKLSYITTLTVNCTAGGNLSSAITAAGGNIGYLTNLTVTGTIDAQDFKRIQDYGSNISVLDLSGVAIAAYTGTGGTGGTTRKTYPANEIPEWAFCDYSSHSGSFNLKSITLPTSLTSIGTYAFAACTGLTGPFTIPSSVSSIGSYAFLNCSNILSIKAYGTSPSSISLGTTVFSGIPTSTCILSVPVGKYADYAAASQWKNFIANMIDNLVIKPSVTTQTVSDINPTSAIGNGTITDLGAPNPSAYGVCWNRIGAPTISDSKVVKGAASTTGPFTASMTSLEAGTLYHVRAYVTNTAGTFYGTDEIFVTLTPGTWIGATDSHWTEASNWAGGVVPTSTTDVTIPSSGIIYSPIIYATESAECNNLSAEYTSIKVLSSESNTGSLIVHGTGSAYARTDVFLTANQWHLVAPQANGTNVSSFIFNDFGISSKVDGSNITYAIADYNEGLNAWNSYFTNSTDGYFMSGKGYTMRLNMNGYVSFFGLLATGTKNVSLTKTGEGWNCIGNPYTSAIKMNAAADATNNFITVNSSNFDASYACIYVWDPSSSNYKIIGNLPSGFASERGLAQNLLQSGQAFFVKAASAASSINFTSAMQVHSNGTPLKSAETLWPSLQLTATSSNIKASTMIAFNNHMTDGLDPTYDAGLLRGTNGLSLSTRLVEDNGVDFAVQCLPEKYDNLIIPVGLDCKVESEITFSAETVDLPVACKVILEDRVSKTFTSLADGATYKTIVSAGTTTVGRFYIRTDENHLTGTAGQTSALHYLNAYVSKNAIIIEGGVSDGAIATLYNVQGVRMFVHRMQKDTQNAITCPNLRNGIYLLTIQQDGETVTKKLIKN